MLGPFLATFVVPELQINRFSYPQRPQHREIAADHGPVLLPGRTVNEGVDPALCSLTYTMVDEMAEIITSLGRAAWMAKVDIESTSLVPNHSPS